jgi:membrane-associated phospholipid phosphatase/MFS family permease
MIAARLARARAWLRNAPEGTAPLALTAFSAAALGAGLGRALLTTYLPVLLERIRDAPGLIGTVMLVNVAAGLVVPICAGIWSDRLRARGHGRTLPFVLGGSLLAAAGLLAVALGTGTSYLVLAILGGVGYVGLNCVTTAHRALIVEGFADEGRPRATAAEELAMLLGGLLGIAVGGVLVDDRPWAPFVIGAVVLPALALPTVLRMRRREARGPAPAAPERHAVRTLLRAARRPVARRLLVAQGLWVVGYAPLPAFFVLYARRVLGLETAQAALWLIGFGAVTGLAMLAAGAARDPARHASLLRLGVLLLGGGLAGIAVASSPAGAAPGLAAAAAGFGLVSTIGFPLLSTCIPPGEAGVYTALYFSSRSVAGAVALPAAGWAIHLSGSYRALPAIGAAATFLALVPLVGIDRRRRARSAARARGAGLALGSLALATVAITAAGAAIAATPLDDLDRRVFRAIHAYGPGSPLLDRLIIDPTIRNYLILGGIALAAGALSRSGRALDSGLAAAVSGVLAFAMVRAAWVLWDRPRPQEALPEVVVTAHDFAPHSSFPSGHVAVTVAMVVAIAALHPRLRAPLWGFVAAMAVTRVLSGAHFPSDVLLAIPLGIVSAVAARHALAPAPAPAPKPDKPVLSLSQ